MFGERLIYSDGKFVFDGKIEFNDEMRIEIVAYYDNWQCTTEIDYYVN